MPRRRKCSSCHYYFDSTTVLLIIFSIGIISFIYYLINYHNLNNNTMNININEKNKHIGLLQDPLVPPLKDGNYFPMSTSTRTIPINIKTRGADVPYRQLGLLTRTNGEETILPLIGRPLYSNRSKWKYYTMTDKNNSVKVPISINGRSCTQEYGCDELTTGDVVYVEGYNDTFKTTVYDNEHFNYIPY